MGQAVLVLVAVVELLLPGLHQQQVVQDQALRCARLEPAELVAKARPHNHAVPVWDHKLGGSEQPQLVQVQVLPTQVHVWPGQEQQQHNEFNQFWMNPLVPKAPTTVEGDKHT